MFFVPFVVLLFKELKIEDKKLNAIFCLVLLYLSYFSHKRYKAIQTYADWAIDTYEKESDNEFNRAKLLNRLYFVNEKDKGKYFSEKFLKNTNDKKNIALVIYYKIFSVENISNREQLKKVIEAVGAYLQKNKNLNEIHMITRANFLKFVYDNLKKVVFVNNEYSEENMLKFSKAITSLFKSQIKIFIQFPREYNELIGVYIENLDYLIRKYHQLFLKNKLTKKGSKYLIGLLRQILIFKNEKKYEKILLELTL
jgi:hypothetical protein